MTSLDRLTKALADRYQIEREIGSGGMATVYLAHDLKHDRQVALKVLNPELARTLGVERFLREIKTVANLSHPHILPLHDSGEADGVLFFVMPFVDGESLRERLEREGPLDTKEAVRILRDVADALGEAHRQGLVHRDLKPANILLTDRHALVADFGVAKAVRSVVSREALTSAGVALGTPSYMAPEQASADAKTDHRADLFALGIVAYEMLTGRGPFTGATASERFAALLTESPPAPHEVRAEVPAWLGAAVMKCLEKEPEDRWQTTDELLLELEQVLTPSEGSVRALPSILATRTRSPLFIAGLVACTVVLVAAFAHWWTGHARERWALNEAIPELEGLAEVGDFLAAHELAIQIEEEVPDSPEFRDLRSQISFPLTIRTDPPGAAVHRRPLSDSSGVWEESGTTPMESVYHPREVAFRYRFQLEGYSPVERVRWSGDTIDVDLEPQGAIPEGMIRVPGFSVDIEGTQYDLPEFLVDRLETTNREYKEFVDAGGYDRREFWEHSFEESGVALTWDEAMSRFTDQTGRPGPSTWQVGDYPEGQDDLPVAGISWYEAAAYARFREKDLPTLFHFRQLRPQPEFPYVVRHANLGSNGPESVGEDHRINRFGTFDLIGNVREWCWNETDGQRHALGGGWNDEDWIAGRDSYRVPAFDRSPTNGVRLVEYPRGDEVLAQAKAPTPPPDPVPDFRAIPQVPDQRFEDFKRNFAYERTPLNATLEGRDSTSLYVRERISFDAAYGGERMVLYLYLPRNVAPPYQPIVYFPGGSALRMPSVDVHRKIHLEMFARNGRAVAFPVFKKTFERGYEIPHPDLDSVTYRDLILQWFKDLGRTLDYLETRSDVASEGVGYFGLSWGGYMGPIMVALESRIESAVWYCAGFNLPRPRAEVDPVYFLPRVSAPVLMIHGRFDATFPLETHARPFFDLVGSDSKDLVIVDGGHLVPFNQLARHTLDWFDRHLGPVERPSDRR